VGPLSDAYVGKWQVESITRAGKTTLVPSTVNAWALFSTKGRIRLYDTANTISGRLEAVKGGFRIWDPDTTLVFYGGDDPVRLLVMDALHAMAEAGRVAASATDNRLAVTVSEFRIVFTRTN
jgi:hypothetical protein